jgi:N-acyl-D-amino-acid deacylase
MLIKYDIVIKNGLVIDGTGTDGSKLDVGINGEKIVALGRLEAKLAKEVIDAAGMVVCPGFIDMHSHSDLVVFNKPGMEPKLRQGITTEVLGQDGLSVTPVPPAGTKEQVEWQRHVAGIQGHLHTGDWSWGRVSSYLEALNQQKTAQNYCYLAGHGNLRWQVMGFSQSRARETELDKIGALLEQALEDGAFGMSTGLIYCPCSVADKQELIYLCNILSKYGAIFVVHMKSESDHILEAVQDMLQIAQETGVHLHISHLKVIGKRNWPKVEQLLALLNEAKEKGISLSFDQYPYTAGSTILSIVLPPWVHEGGQEELLKRLADRELRAQIDRDIREGLPGWENLVDLVGWKNIYVSSVATEKNQQLVGKNIAAIAAEMGVNPVDTVMDLILAEKNKVDMVDFMLNEQGVEKILQHPLGTVCTDGLLTDNPHPRVFGSFPRILGRYCRGKQVLILPQAIHKMTGLSAKVLGLTNRGLIQVGYQADVVVFDPNKVIDLATYENPCQYATGIEYVLVNGQIAIDKNEQTWILSGRGLKKI